MLSMPGDLQPDDLQARLATFSLFQALDQETLRALAAESQRRDYNPGQVVFLEGESAEGLYIVESGWVRAVKISEQGREQVLQFVGPGEPFNTVTVFSGGVSPATAVALEPTVIWVVPTEAIRRLLRERPDFAESVLKSMAERMIHLVSLVADLSLRTVSERLAQLILDRAEGAVLSRPRWFTMAELAARLGTVPDVVQRAMGRLQFDGLVEVNRREIRILNEVGLREVAHVPEP